MLQHWALTFLGNLAGALFIVGVIIGHGGVLSGDAYRKEALAIATAVRSPSPRPLLFFRFQRAKGHPY